MISLYLEQSAEIEWIVVDRRGIMVNPETIRWRILSIDGSSITEIEGWSLLDLESAIITTGRYKIEWSVPDDLDTDLFYRIEVEWTVDEIKRTAWKTIEVLPYDVGLAGQHYCFLKDLKDEGIMPSAGDPTRYASLINSASGWIRKITQRSFHPQYKKIDIDQISRGSILFLDEPIIGIEKIEFPELWTGEADDAIYEVYARHLSQNLFSPDDRDHPHIKFHGGFRNILRRSYESVRIRGGPQGITLHGVFGYTEPDGSCDGRTPEDIRRVCAAIVYRDSPLLSEFDEREDRQSRGYITSEKTHSQSYTKDGAGVSKGITGDRWIDTILSRYSKPFNIGVM